MCDLTKENVHLRRSLETVSLGQQVQKQGTSSKTKIPVTYSLASDSGSIRINANKRKELPLHQYKAPLQLTPPNLDEIVVNIIIRRGLMIPHSKYLATLTIQPYIGENDEFVILRAGQMQRSDSSRAPLGSGGANQTLTSDRGSSNPASQHCISSQTPSEGPSSRRQPRPPIEDASSMSIILNDPEDDSQILAHTSIWFVEPEHFKKYDPNHKGYTKEIVLNHDLFAIKTLPADAEKFIFQYGGKPIDLLALNLKWGHRDFTDESTGVEVDDKAKKISLCMKKTERMRMMATLHHDALTAGATVRNEITHLLQGKNYEKLIELESNIEVKLAGDKLIDPEYWVSLLVQLNLKGMHKVVLDEVVKIQAELASTLPYQSNSTCLPQGNLQRNETHEAKNEDTVKDAEDLREGFKIEMHPKPLKQLSDEDQKLDLLLPHEDWNKNY
ncbi:hypothetical protein BY996DRAFT_6454965 [Phakopsora pachyrhizi]|nr:hypothetical protein BY996DRAFT_6454965 [Phakopsora pachyrhizi]